jgi:hypothetical protein
LFHDCIMPLTYFLLTCHTVPSGCCVGARPIWLPGRRAMVITAAPPSTATCSGLYTSSSPVGK